MRLTDSRASGVGIFQEVPSRAPLSAGVGRQLLCRLLCPSRLTDTGAPAGGHSARPPAGVPNLSLWQPAQRRGPPSGQAGWGAGPAEAEGEPRRGRQAGTSFAKAQTRGNRAASRPGGGMKDCESPGIRLCGAGFKRLSCFSKWILKRTARQEKAPAEGLGGGEKAPKPLARRTLEPPHKAPSLPAPGRRPRDCGEPSGCPLWPALRLLSFLSFRPFPLPCSERHGATSVWSTNI